MSDWLIERIHTLGDRPFLAQGSSIHTYSELDEQIAQYATALQNQGLQAGDVVTLETDYSLHGIAALFALFHLRAIAAPIATAPKVEIQQRQQVANAKWSLQIHNNTPTPLIPLSPPQQSAHSLVIELAHSGHAGLILFSSGSTGQPKAMIHNTDHLLNQFIKKRKRRLNILIFLLFDHIGGLNTLFNGLASGALIVTPHSRDANIVAEAIQQHRVNLLPASPTFLNLFLLSNAHRNYDLSSLRFITYGTEPMPESLLLRLKEALPDVAFIQTFGTSETGISQTVSRSSSSTQIKIDDPNSEYKIVDGELWLRSKSQILGYLNHEMSRFTEDGWFKTGDLVEQADDGFLTITGRREDLINVGGEKVSPSEVESVLLELPEVADCLVYGEQNAITGQNVAAEIVPALKIEPTALKRIIKKYCRHQLSPYKTPARITFCEATSFNERFKKSRISQARATT
jgi:acyl-coenzyme A synthetase/AMP-(fatty) acid ligase